ncbi:C40 family peptidase [Streptomyces cinereospinus]|uniref:NlpC/P60 family protein n=1 Tax=Streptomyces cinereospinus TaxID=285561 RepID=A0ABV5N3N3_9ACTN
MARGKRGLIAAAVTVVGAVTVLTAPGAAFAAPAPAPTSSATAGPAPATNAELEAVRKRLDTLYREAAAATDAYNAADEQARRQSAEVAALAERIAEGRERLAELRRLAGAAAAAQYRTGGLPPEAVLVLSDDPGEFLDGTGRVRQGERATQHLLTETARTQQDVEQYAQDASAQEKELEVNREAKATAQQRIEARIEAARKLESQLAQEEKARLARLEAEAARRAQTAWLGSGILDEIDGTATEQGEKAGESATEQGEKAVESATEQGEKAVESATEQGEKAVEFATGQIGKPYEWGAEGPKAYDCSGLTSQAWAAAGRAIPRTSQEQWQRLRRVAVQDMRPGDLIIYFGDASHVGMYVGDGAMVHAPRPGRTITVAGAGSMPILGVVRPAAG